MWHPGSIPLAARLPAAAGASGATHLPGRCRCCWPEAPLAASAACVAFALGGDRARKFAAGAVPSRDVRARPALHLWNGACRRGVRARLKLIHPPRFEVPCAPAIALHPDCISWLEVRAHPAHRQPAQSVVIMAPAVEEPRLVRGAPVPGPWRVTGRLLLQRASHGLVRSPSCRDAVAELRALLRPGGRKARPVHRR